MAESEENGSIREEIDSMIENKELEEDSMILTRSCRSQCTRKLKTSANGKVTGCPCKGNGLRCGGNCSCGTKTKPCKNKSNDNDDLREGGPSRTHSTQQDEQIDEISVQEMLESLDHETLLKVAKQGFMSRRLILKDIIVSVQNNAGDPTEAPTQANVLPPFCVCGHCREMPTEKERVCCKEKHLCRSRSAVFQNVCIDSDNVATVIRSRADTYVFTPTYDHRAMRHAAYQQYVMWQHGHLGKDHRRVIPSCCVWEIRKHYHSANGRYTGYKDKQKNSNIKIVDQTKNVVFLVW